jgi:hypothetical protein
MWLYITGLENGSWTGLFEYCSQLAPYQCLFLTIISNGPISLLYFGFFAADCPGIRLLTLNTWIHVAFVFDLTTLTQNIYLNGMLDNSCMQSSALTGTPTSITIGYLPMFETVLPVVTYFEVMTSSQTPDRCI